MPLQQPYGVIQFEHEERQLAIETAHKAADPTTSLRLTGPRHRPHRPGDRSTLQQHLRCETLHEVVESGSSSVARLGTLADHRRQPRNRGGTMVGSSGPMISRRPKGMSPM